MTTDYKNTVFLPDTSFPMRGNLPQREPEILRQWEEMDLDDQLLHHNAGEEKFILHDGPPYANGNLHIGHALNKILKDVICRHQRMLGKHVPYVPGWDCHGLPIEWKIEEKYRAAKQNKDDVPVLQFRQECRDYAAHWIDVQREEFRRLGVSGDWQNPYTTMTYAAEAQIVRELHTFLGNGTLYQGFKPVLWSVVEQTALAEAEVEYIEKESTEVYVRFPVVYSPVKELEHASIVIWTTTPWTLPANAAVACNPELDYAVIEVLAVADNSRAVVGERLVLATALVESVCRTLGIVKWAVVRDDIRGAELSLNAEKFRSQAEEPHSGTQTPIFKQMTLCQHGIISSEEDTGKRLLVFADFVTAEQGTGFVHIAPAHGEDDFNSYLTHNIIGANGINRENDYWYFNGYDISENQYKILHNFIVFPKLLHKNGVYKEKVSDFAGMYIFKESTTEAIINKLYLQSQLLYKSKFKHSYPHSWRSKAPLIYLATPQWFIALDKPVKGTLQLPLPLGEGGGEGLHNTAHSVQKPEDLSEPFHAALPLPEQDPHPNPLPEGEGTCAAPLLRTTALSEVDSIRFFPRTGQNRLRTMIETRPDWCISRQRVWGVPIMLLVHRETQQPLRDRRVLDRIADLVEQNGCDIWFDDAVIPQVLTDPATGQLFADPETGKLYQPTDYTRVTDILDVWFDSGSAHAFVLEQRPLLQKQPTPDNPNPRPADLYLEGSDQHRGWFQSSLLESCGTRGRAPYDAVLTHGFVLDEQGRKMSKSLGNVVAPQDVIAKYGADILRLWVISSDYYGDLRIGPAILEHHADLYRRLRNTLRYLLGSLKDFDPVHEHIDVRDMPELDRLILHRLHSLDQLFRKAQQDYSFHALYQELHQFCAVDLSAFYFDIRKDALYCDSPDSPRRRAARLVMAHVLDCLTAWLAPVLCFTAEEAWQAGREALTQLAPKGATLPASVHLRAAPVLPDSWQDTQLANRWEGVKQVRRVVLAALERERADKRIGSSLQASPAIYISPEMAESLHSGARNASADTGTPAYLLTLTGAELAELCITSGATVTLTHPDSFPADAFSLPDVPGVAVLAQRAEGEKCVRCWQVLPEVGTHPVYPELCGRCAAVVS
jgi:isoleucyl-tRNA synthetase